MPQTLRRLRQLLRSPQHSPHEQHSTSSYTTSRDLTLRTPKESRRRAVGHDALPDPLQLAKLQADPALVDRAVEEFLRYDNSVTIPQPRPRRRGRRARRDDDQGR
jgi:hypothetical protein